VTGPGLRGNFGGEEGARRAPARHKGAP